MKYLSAIVWTILTVIIGLLGIGLFKLSHYDDKLALESRWGKCLPSDCEIEEIYSTVEGFRQDGYRILVVSYQKEGEIFGISYQEKRKTLSEEDRERMKRTLQDLEKKGMKVSENKIRSLEYIGTLKKDNDTLIILGNRRERRYYLFEERV